jgi:hypothetical protein
MVLSSGSNDDEIRPPCWGPGSSSFTPSVDRAADDDLPLVVLDRAAEVAALPVASPLTVQAQDYLRAQGITDERTWAAFRLNGVDPAVYARLGLVGHRAVRDDHLNLPTCDPRHPDVICGVIRLSPAQNKHRFITTPAGLGGPVDLDRQQRIILTDTPFLALRLHAAGARHTALVEHPAVLPPLVPWLTGRVVTLASYKHPGLAALRAALGDRVAPDHAVLVRSSLSITEPDTLSILGIDPVSVRDPGPRPPITPLLVKELYAFAEGRITTAAGMAALSAIGMDSPDLVAAFRPGYLPVDVRQALPPSARAACAGIELGNCLAIPAWDDQGVIADLLLVQACDGGHTVTSLWSEPRGMVAPVLATAYRHLVVTDTPRWLGRLSATGQPALLVRGLADLRANLGRLVAGGVASVAVCARASSGAMADLLHAAGLAVELRNRDGRHWRPAQAPMAVEPPAVVPTAEPAAAPAPAPAPAPELPAAPAAVLAPASESTAPAPPTLTLVRHDPVAEQALFQLGPATVTVQVPWGDGTSLEVVIAVDGRRHRDRFDLASAAQRLRFAISAAQRTGLPSAQIAAAVAEALPRVQALAQPAAAAEPVPSAPTLAPADQAAALAYLRDDHLLARVGADLAELAPGVDPEALALLFLAAVSRLGSEPLWLVLTATAPDERFPVLDVLAAITPPEHLVHVSRLTDNALFHGDAAALRHRLLLIDDAAAITPSVATALKVLHARGSLIGTQVERDGLLGAMRTRFVAAHGPLAVITATAGDVPAALRHQLLGLPLDDDPGHGDRHLLARCRRWATPAASTAGQAATRLRQAQSLLAPLPVVIPDLSPTALPTAVTGRRALQDACLGVIAASALLHQHQRPRFEGHVVATAADLATAARLVTVLAARTSGDLPLRAQRLLAALAAGGGTAVTMASVEAALPGWPRSTLRRAIDDLIRAEHLAPVRGRPGQAREYRLLPALYGTANREPGHLATPGHAGWPPPSDGAACG